MLTSIVLLKVKKNISFLIIIIFLLYPLAEAKAFTGALSKIAQLVFKEEGVISKTISKTENFQSLKSLEIETLNKKIIEQIGAENNSKYIKLLRDGSDEAILAEHGYKAEANINDEKFYDYVLPAWRTYRIDLKPNNSIYICESNNQVFQFSILPMKNKAAIFSSYQNLDKQMLRIEYSKANATVLSLNYANSKMFFVLLPNYKFFFTNKDNYENILKKINDKTIYPNGTCFDTNLEKLQIVRYQIDSSKNTKVTQEKKNEVKSNEKVKISYTPIYLILLSIIYIIISDRLFKKFSSNMVFRQNFILFNVPIVACLLSICLVLSLSGVTIDTNLFLKILFIILSLFFAFVIYANIKFSYTIYKIKNNLYYSKFQRIYCLFISIIFPFLAPVFLLILRN